jgi:BirA family transcriptional regulator, biotin operon repressor / biotin---[acetyl-CoA-carboxylase] ligase
VFRPPLDIDALTASLPAPWRSITVADRLDSTNETALAHPSDYPAGAVLVAEHQAAGRGRLDRIWVTPARAALTFSAVLRPDVARPAWSWLPLLAGLAVRDALSWATDADVTLKWPNDVLLGSKQHKVAGILVQVQDDRAVVGVGVNVSTTAAELPVRTAKEVPVRTATELPVRTATEPPVPTATSLALVGADAVDRTVLLLDVLRALGTRYLSWRSAAGDAEACDLARDYRSHCVTLGQLVRVTALGGDVRRGTAQGIDSDGRLVIDADGRPYAISAGDVEHLRPDDRECGVSGHG